MKNFEKYEKEIKELDYCFGFNAKTKEILECCDCCDCLFCDKEQEDETSLPCRDDKIIKWLYEEYNSKAQLTIEEIEELLKDKYPNGIEVVK